MNENRDAVTPAGRPERTRRIEAIVVFVVAVAVHAVTLGNRYALDDEIVIQRNLYVQCGISGLADIFTHDSYQSFYETMGAAPQLAGGRYRPLAEATFAIEQSLLGETLGGEYERIRREIAAESPSSSRSMQLRERLRELLEVRIRDAGLAIAPYRHAVQLVLFGASMVALLLFFRLLFPSSPETALVATLLFATHPIHTEVVANIKSRDEILSLLFVALSGIALFRHDESRRPRDMALASLFLALALLSKEYAVVAPVVLGAALVLARGRRPLDVLRSWSPLLPVLAGYLALRYVVIGETPPVDLAKQDILNDPFLPLRLGQAQGSVLATKLSILPEYLRLLAWPHPLSSDYSYATFPYASFASPSVWASIALHLVLIGLAIFAWRKRNVVAFAGVAYFAFLFPVSNLPFDIGATMGERLAYHASLGFAVLLAWLCVEIPRRLLAAAPARAIATWLAVGVLCVPYAIASVVRDAQWKDDRTLFLADVKTVPNSALANGNAGAQTMNPALEVVRRARENKRSLIPDESKFVHARADAALVYLRKAVAIHPRYANSWINIGICLYYKDELDAAAGAFAKAASIYGRHPVLQQYGTNFYALGMDAARAGDLERAVVLMRHAVTIWPYEIGFWRDYAGAGFMSLHFAEASAAFGRVLELAPGDADAQRGQHAAEGLERLERATKERPGEPALLREYANALLTNGAPPFQQRGRLYLSMAAAMEKDRGR